MPQPTILRRHFRDNSFARKFSTQNLRHLRMTDSLLTSDATVIEMADNFLGLEPNQQVPRSQCEPLREECEEWAEMLDSTTSFGQFRWRSARTKRKRSQREEKCSSSSLPPIRSLRVYNMFPNDLTARWAWASPTWKPYNFKFFRYALITSFLRAR